jgi:hypothetical protein
VTDVLTHIPLFRQVLSLSSTSLLQQEPGNTELGLETFRTYQYSEKIQPIIEGKHDI